MFNQIKPGDLCFVCRIPNHVAGYEHNGKLTTAVRLTHDGSWLVEPPFFNHRSGRNFDGVMRQYLEPVKKFPDDELIETKKEIENV